MKEVPKSNGVPFYILPCFSFLKLKSDKLLNAFGLIAFTVLLYKAFKGEL